MSLYGGKMGIRKIQGRRSPGVPLFPPPVVANRSPTPTDTNFDLGQIWVDTLTITIFILADVSGSATWSQATTAGGSPIQTLTGDGGGGAVGPTGGNIDLAVGNDTGLQFVGVPGTSTMDLDPQLVSVQTTDATPTTLDTVALVTNTVATAFWILSYKRDDSTEGGGGTVIASARRAGAGGILIGTPNVIFNEDSAGTPSVTAVVVGNNLLLQVTGEAAKTLDWDTTFVIVRRT